MLLVAGGIAAGAALLAAVFAGSLVAQDRSVERATARVPAADRTVRLVWGGIGSGPGTDVDKLDRISRRALTPLVGSPTRALLFRTSQSNGHLFDLGGDRRPCALRASPFRTTAASAARRSAAKCWSSAAPGPPPTLQGLALSVVGKATLDSPVPFGEPDHARDVCIGAQLSAAVPHRADPAAVPRERRRSRSRAPTSSCRRSAATRGRRRCDREPCIPGRSTASRARSPRRAPTLQSRSLAST